MIHPCVVITIITFSYIIYSIKSYRFEVIDELYNEKINKKDDVFKCVDVKHANGIDESTCCRVLVVDDVSRKTLANSKDFFSIKCLPSFIIAGCQKSGTTALSGTSLNNLFSELHTFTQCIIAFLTSHNFISFPTRKEV